MHPENMYELVKLRISEDLAQAERERLVRRAGVGSRNATSDPIRFRERVARVFGGDWPSLTSGSTRPAGA
jgi:hypothetical protein